MLNPTAGRPSPYGPYAATQEDTHPTQHDQENTFETTNEPDYTVELITGADIDFCYRRIGSSGRRQQTSYLPVFAQMSPTRTR